MMDCQRRNGIVKFQALWRGYRTRKWVQETRKDYQDIFTNIQQSFNHVSTQVHWPNRNICLPTFRDRPQSQKRVATCKNDGNEAQKEETRLENSVSSSGEDATSLNYMSVEQKKTDGAQQPFQHSSTSGDSDRTVTTHSEGSFPTYNSLKNSSILTNKPPDVDDFEKVSHVSTEFSVPLSDLQHENDDTDAKSQSSIPSAMDPLDFVETSSTVIEANGGVDRRNVLTDSWMTQQSFNVSENGEADMAGLESKSEADLVKMKENLSLELLWIGQAITSRKSYLQMKNGMC